MAAAAWQCVAACAAVAAQQHPSAIANLTGCNQQAIGVRFQACPNLLHSRNIRP